MEKENKNYVVRFSGNHAASSISGALGGVIIAVGVPFIVLSYGGGLGTAVQTGLVIGSVALGGLIVLVSAVLGLTMPSQVGGGGHDWDCNEK